MWIHILWWAVGYIVSSQPRTFILHLLPLCKSVRELTLLAQMPLSTGCACQIFRTWGAMQLLIGHAGWVTTHERVTARKSERVDVWMCQCVNASIGVRVNVSRVYVSKCKRVEVCNCAIFTSSACHTLDYSSAWYLSTCARLNPMPKLLDFIIHGGCSVVMVTIDTSASPWSSSFNS